MVIVVQVVEMVRLVVVWMLFWWVSTLGGEELHLEQPGIVMMIKVIVMILVMLVKRERAGKQKDRERSEGW